MASPSTTSTPAGSTTVRRTGSRWRSSSTATTLAPGLGQGQAQRAQPRPELEHRGAGSDVGQPGDAPDRVGIGDEVLTEGPAGTEPVCREQRRDVSTGMSHQEIVTSTTPWLGVGQLGEARRGHVDDPRVPGLFTIIDGARRAGSGRDVRHRQDGPEREAGAGAHPRGCGGVPRGLAPLSLGRGHGCGRTLNGGRRHGGGGRRTRRHFLGRRRRGRGRRGRRRSAAASAAAGTSSPSSTWSWSWESTCSPPAVKAMRRRRPSAHGPRARPDVTMRSSRVPHAPIHVTARGEALRTRRHRGPWRRRGASPECSVSAGLHPSPGTVHPRRHKAGEGERAEHRDSMGTRANENDGSDDFPISFPQVRA